jgi:hypothetical protein
MDTSVPPSLHPAALTDINKALDNAGPLGIDAVKTAREAMTIVHGAYARLEDVAKLIDDPELHKTNAFIAAATMAYKRVTPQLEQKLTALKAAHQQLNDKVADALDDPGRKSRVANTVASDVRNHVKTLAEQERVAFMMDAIQHSDVETLAAVLHAQPFLSGLTREQHAQVKEEAAKKFAPQEISHRHAEATAKLIEQVQSAATVLQERFAKVELLKSTPEAIVNQKITALKALK